MFDHAVFSFGQIRLGGTDILVKRLLTLGFGYLKLRTLHNPARNHATIDAYGCDYIHIAFIREEWISVFFSYGVGSSLLVSVGWASSKASNSGTGNNEGSALFRMLFY